MLVAVAVLSAMGIITIIAASPLDGNKQCYFLVVAIGCMALFQAVNYQKIGQFAWVFYAISLLLVAYTVVVGGTTLPQAHHPREASLCA